MKMYAVCLFRTGQDSNLVFWTNLIYMSFRCAQATFFARSSWFLAAIFACHPKFFFSRKQIEIESETLGINQKILKSDINF